MNTPLFLFCDGLCLAAHIAIGYVACRERLLWPVAYAAFCAAMCMGSMIGVASAAFRASFGTVYLPVWIAGWALYLVAALLDVQSMGAEYQALAIAALGGVGISILIGFLMDRGNPRIVLQAVVAILPIVAALATVGARTLPEPIIAPAYYSPAGDPAPPVGVTL